MIAAVDRALALATDRTRIIPGHGPLASKADLQAYRDMLATVLARIKAQLAAGKPTPEIVDSKPTREFDDKWGNGFIKPDALGEHAGHWPAQVTPGHRAAGVPRDQPFGSNLSDAEFMQ